MYRYEKFVISNNISIRGGFVCTYLAIFSKKGKQQFDTCKSLEKLNVCLLLNPSLSSGGTLGYQTVFWGREREREILIIVVYFQRTADNGMGSKNNLVSVKRSDFEVFQALDMDSESASDRQQSKLLCDTIKSILIGTRLRPDHEFVLIFIKAQCKE